MTVVQRSPVVASILACALRIHKALGPGLLESTYDHCFAYEFAVSGVKYRRQVPVPVQYHDVEISCGYRVDYVVEDEVLLEIKSVQQLTPLHHAQVLTYLKLTGHRRGLLINFNVKRLMDGVKSLLLDRPTSTDDADDEGLFDSEGEVSNANVNVLASGELDD